MPFDSSTATTPDSPDHPRRNWPLIWTAVIVGLFTAGTVLGLVALYVTNFNLLEWME